MPSKPVMTDLSVLTPSIVVPFDLPSSKVGTPSIHILQHCFHHWDTIFLPAVSRERIMGLCQSSSLVRNAVLALAATHLRTASPRVRAHHAAENFHSLVAVYEYRRALQIPLASVDPSFMKTLLLSATLLNMMAFALPGSEVPPDGGQPDPSDSWVLGGGGGGASDGDSLGWITLQAGLRPLILSMAPYQSELVEYLTSIFAGMCAPARWGISHDTSDVPRHWVEVFGMDGHDARGCESDDVYDLPVFVLAHLQRAEDLTPHHHLLFLSKASVEFRARLARWDERALWLLGYWLGLVSRYEGLWWSEGRARRDYGAICEWFRARRRVPGREGMLWDRMIDDLRAAPTIKVSPMVSSC